MGKYTTYYGNCPVDRMPTYTKNYKKALSQCLSCKWGNPQESMNIVDCIYFRKILFNIIPKLPCKKYEKLSSLQ